MRADNLHPKDVVNRTMEDFKKQAAGKIHIIETEVITKNKERIPVSINASKTEFGGNPCVLGIFRDITEHKKTQKLIEKQNEFVKTVINSLQYPFYVIDTDYTIILTNKAAKERGIAEGSRCYQVTHHRQEPCSGEHICPLKEVIRTGKPTITDHIHFDNDGNCRNFEVHGDPILDKDGQVIQMIEYSIDITERKRAEEEIKKRVEELEKFNRLTVDRELKMIELKRRINELEGKLKEGKKWGLKS